VKRQDAINRVEKAAENAWYWVSMSPRKRAAQYLDEFTSKLDQYRDEVKKIDPNAVDDFTEKYTDKAVTWLNALSRTASSMVTGPANFPVEKNRRKQAIERDKQQDLYSYPDYYLKRLDRKTKRASGYDLPAQELERQKAKLAELEETHRINLAGNKILRAGGDNETVRKKLAEIGAKGKDIDFYLRERTKEGKFIFGFSSTNSRANIKRTKERIAELERKIERSDAGGMPPLKFEGGEMVQNYADDRFQILFDGIPSADIRTQLKRYGLRWSPRNKAWQRKLTQNAIYAMESVAMYLGIDADTYNNWAFKKKAAPKAKKENPKGFIENWEEKILGKIQMEIGVGRSDAQNMMQAKSFELQQAWTKGLSANATFDQYFKPTGPHHCDELAEDIAHMEREQMEAIQDLAEDVPALIILENMPDILPASAEAETGGKVGTQGDISIGLTSNKGVTVEGAAERLKSDFGHRLPSESEIRDTIIEILKTGKRNFRAQILADEKALSHDIKEKRQQIKDECVTDNLPPDIDLTALALAKAKAVALKLKYKYAAA